MRGPLVGSIAAGVAACAIVTLLLLFSALRKGRGGDMSAHNRMVRSIMRSQTTGVAPSVSTSEYDSTATATAARGPSSMQR